MRIKTENVDESLEPVDIDKAGSEASEEGTYGLKFRQTAQPHHPQLWYLSYVHQFSKYSAKRITRIITSIFFSFSSSPVSSDCFSYTCSKYSSS